MHRYCQWLQIAARCGVQIAEKRNASTKLMCIAFGGRGCQPPPSFASKQIYRSKKRTYQKNISSNKHKEESNHHDESRVSRQALYTYRRILSWVIVGIIYALHAAAVCSMWNPAQTVVDGRYGLLVSKISFLFCTPLLTATIFLSRSRPRSLHLLYLTFLCRHSGEKRAEKHNKVPETTKTEEGSARRNIARKHDHDPTKWVLSALCI